MQHNTTHTKLQTQTNTKRTTHYNIHENSPKNEPTPAHPQKQTHTCIEYAKALPGFDIKLKVMH
eukprot:m.297925 g.297925  ORF g.297925 m.297925 type:complete len:64 (-) comp274456_c0_seq1:80-271(-)